MIKVETARAATHWSPSKSSILNCNKSFTFLAVGTVSICSVRTPKSTLWKTHFYRVPKNRVFVKTGFFLRLSWVEDLSKYF